MSTERLYHRQINSNNADEIDKVRRSGELWGKQPRQVAGNGPACVKAYVGALPENTKGYTFTTAVEPSAYKTFLLRKGAIWEEDAPGVFDVEGEPEYVGIKVKIIGI